MRLKIKINGTLKRVINLDQAEEIMIFPDAVLIIVDHSNHVSFGLVGVEATYIITQQQYNGMVTFLNNLVGQEVDIA